MEACLAPIHQSSYILGHTWVGVEPRTLKALGQHFSHNVLDAMENGKIIF